MADSASAKQSQTTMAGPSSSFQTLPNAHESETFANSGFLRRENLSGLLPANLTQNRLTIFERHLILRGVHREATEQGLRLASNLVVAALPAFHAILCGGFKATGEVDDEGRPLYAFPRPLIRLTQTQADETFAKLNELNKCLKFKLYHEDDGNHACTIEHKEATPGVELPGVGSDIVLSRSVLEELVDSHKSCDLIWKQWSAFHFANVLIHELGHAAVNAVKGADTRNSEFYLGDSKSTEMGFELQNYLFGGIPDLAFQNSESYWDEGMGDFSELDQIITLSQYPCPAASGHYDSKGCSLNVRRGETSATLLWNVSFPHINRMFQDDFWNTEFRKRGPKALHFEKETGYFFVPDSHEPVLPHPSETKEVPVGYWIDRNGLIRKRVDKKSNMEQSQTEEFHLAMCLQKATLKGQSSKVSLRRTATKLYRKVSRRVDADVELVSKSDAPSQPPM